ncbi:MAG: FIST N-terminal domain-containing protein [Rubrivivax sp.]
MSAPFIVGHATHPDWRAALGLVAAQIDGQVAAHDASGAGPLSLGFVYFSDHYAPHAKALVDGLRARWPGVSWVGSVGVGVAAGGVEYIDEPALVLMVAALAAGRFQLFSGARKLERDDLFSALVHADPATPDLPELIAELSDRTESGYLFGGLASSRAGTLHIADGVWQGGLSGVGFTRDVALVSRVTQGCQPIGPTRTITACERNLVLELDGEPALPCLMRDLGINESADPREALPRLRATLVGLTDALDTALARGGQFGTDTRVRHLIGLDPGQQAVAVADVLQTGVRLAFCQRDAVAARRDLVRVCSEIREELDAPVDPVVVPQPSARFSRGAARGEHGGPAAPPILGAIYISCAGRGGAHFGGPSAELKIVQHALGDVPLVGFFASGEIARHHLYGYTGVLTVFTAAA